MKKILMLLQSEFPPDIRLEKEIKSLSFEGYKIIVLCNQFSKGLAPNFKYCSIERIAAIFNSKKLNKIINIPIFFNPRIIFKLIQIIKIYRPDFLHAHDLPMVPLAIFGRLLFKLPVIYDMHENYPDALVEFQKKGIFNWIFKNPKLAKILDRFCIQKSDRIIVVVEENKQRLIEEGIKEEIISVVSNTVDLDTFNNPADYTENKFVPDNKTILMYSGTISADRGLITPVKAMRSIVNKNLNVSLLLIGDGDNKEFLMNFVEQNGLASNIQFIAWPGHENISYYIYKASICIIPQPSNNFINNTIPHKLFEYMACSKPVLVSNATPLKRIINETGAGEYFISNNPGDFERKIFQMLENLSYYGANGFKAVKQKYNWNNDAKVLISLYNELSASLKE